MSPKIEELRKICQSTSTVEDDITERIERIFSIYITRIFIATPLSANHITFINMMLGVIGSFLIAFGDAFWLKLLGLFVMFGTSVMDGVDGEVARYKNQTSLTGLYLDRLNAALTGWILFLSIGFGLYFRSQDLLTLLFGVSASSSWLFMRITFLLLRVNALDAATGARYKETQKSVETARFEKPPTLYGTSESMKKLSLPVKIVDFLTLRYIIMIFTLIASILLEILVGTFAEINVLGIGYPLSGLSLFLALYGILLPVITVGYVVYNVKHRMSEYVFINLNKE
jgi:hypothetical protein